MEPLEEPDDGAPSEEAYEEREEPTPAGAAPGDLLIRVEGWEHRRVPEDVVFFRVSTAGALPTRTTWRRFSDFEQLSQQLRRMLPQSSGVPRLFHPYLVRQHLIGDPAFLAQRAAKLQTYLRRLAAVPAVAGSFPFRLFLHLYDLRNRVAVVTGANAGIGRVTAEAFAAMGARVVLACRSEARALPVVDAINAAEETREAGGQAEFMPLDLNTLAGVRAFVTQFTARHQQLHLLVNNAGLAAPPAPLTGDGLEVHYGVNFVAQFHLTELLLPLLTASQPSRVVFVSSIGHVQCKAELLLQQMQNVRRPVGDDALAKFNGYRVSKLALSLYAAALAARLDGRGVSCFHLHPGAVATEVWRSLPGVLQWLAAKAMLPAEQGALTQLYLSLHPGLERFAGRYFDQLQLADPHPALADLALRARLCAETAQVVAGIEALDALRAT